MSPPMSVNKIHFVSCFNTETRRRRNCWVTKKNCVYDDEMSDDFYDPSSEKAANGFRLSKYFTRFGDVAVKIR